jgi:hypothetical protein
MLREALLIALDMVTKVALNFWPANWGSWKVAVKPG